MNQFFLKFNPMKELEEVMKTRRKEIAFLFLLTCNYPRLRLFEFKTFFFFFAMKIVPPYHTPLYIVNSIVFFSVS